MSTSLHTIHSSLLSLLRALDPDSRGDPHTLTNTSHLSQLALSLLTLTVPKLWLDAIGPTAAPASWPLKEWTQDLALRWVFLDQVVTLGLAKVPTYWLGAFFNPGAFLSVIMQVCGPLFLPTSPPPPPLLSSGLSFSSPLSPLPDRTCLILSARYQEPQMRCSSWPRSPAGTKIT